MFPLLLVSLFLPLARASFEPGDFQLFTTIFFVLLACGIVLSLGFGAALYFFWWLGRRRKAGQQQQWTDTVAPTQQVWTTNQMPNLLPAQRDSEQSYHLASGKSPTMAYAQVNDNEQFHESGRPPTLRERMASVSTKIGNSLHRAKLKVNAMLVPLVRRSTSATHFPTESPQPSAYINVQGPDFSPNWLTSAEQQIPIPPLTTKKPKSILKKPKRRLKEAGREIGDGPRPLRVPVIRTFDEEPSRRAPPPFAHWQWSPQLTEVPCECVVEDRVEREESCVRGRLVAVERLTRTTTTTRDLSSQPAGTYI